MGPSGNEESWNSKVGVIFAVAGSAVGIGNFLRFPGQIAEYGGGAFMIAYLISFVLMGLPLVWSEWTMGRFGGLRGSNSAPGIFASISSKPIAKYLGVLCVAVPLLIYMYLSYIEAWCLGYAVNFFAGNLDFSSINEAQDFWLGFIGAFEDGSALDFSIKGVGIFLIAVFCINFYLIYKGISAGIERFCKTALPVLLILGVVVLVRVMTLGVPDIEQPENNIENGLGFMWNPTKIFLEHKEDGEWVRERELVGEAAIEDARVFVGTAGNAKNYRMEEVGPLEQLSSPRLWLAAGSQVFFSLSVGFGIVITYASYMRRDDDVALSSLSAASANEFSEIGLGGLITVPAAFAFFGAASIAGQGVFGLGFKVLPMVFSAMPGGAVFGGIFFFMLFLATVSGVISTLQPSIAFLEEALNLNRKSSVALLGMIAGMGAAFVVWFSADAKALDTLDFWVANLMIFLAATVQVIMFAWVLGTKKGFEELHEGAAVRIPKIFQFVVKFITPTFLLTIFGLWLVRDVFGIGGSGEIDSHITDLIGGDGAESSRVARMTFILIALVVTFLCLLASKIQKRDQDDG